MDCVQGLGVWISSGHRRPDLAARSFKYIKPHYGLAPAAGAIALLVFGAAGVVWTIHLAQVSGDFERWAVLINLAMIGLTILHLWSERPEASPS